MTSRRARLYVLGAVFAAGFVTIALSPRISLGATYHYFVDQRTILGIPNALDVLSNLLFLIAGLLGIRLLLLRTGKQRFQSKWERLPYFVFFFGVALTGLGSAYYHLAPDNQRLIWDLLPMTLSFGSLVAATIMERVSTRAGLVLLIPFVCLSAASVLYWYQGEMQGHGDYRFYLFVQFFSAFAIGATVLLFPSRYTGAGYLGTAFALYVLAKLFEAFDGPIYSFGHIVSGHTLKHITAGVACYWIVRMLQFRHSIQFDALNVQAPDHVLDSVAR